MTAACDSGRILSAKNSLTPIARSLIEFGRHIVSRLLMIEICEAIHAHQRGRVLFPLRLLSLPPLVAASAPPPRTSLDIAARMLDC
jgi:hypothetical protein